jgi:allantoin racemase
MTRIKLIVPFPASKSATAARGSSFAARLRPDTVVDAVAVRTSGTLADSEYETALFDFALAGAGLRAEEEGFDAVVVDTVADWGVPALRSRLSIPVVAPGVLAYASAVSLGRRFSVLSTWRGWNRLYERTLVSSGLDRFCASIRAPRVDGEIERAIVGRDALTARAVIEQDEQATLSLLAELAKQAIEDDGADVLVLGSMTMGCLAGGLRELVPAPVIDPAPLALGFAELLIGLGLSHSKIAYPSPSTILDEKFSALIGADDQA